MSTDLMTSTAGYQQLSTEIILQRVDGIKELMTKAMTVGVHYGTIPGTGKPTLFKPGAEKLCMLFRLVPEFMVVERDHENGHKSFSVKCRLRHVPTGELYGEGEGYASTLESKYRYRYASGYDIISTEIPKDYQNKKTEFRKQGYGAKLVNGAWVWVKYTESEKVENPDIADVYNTVLKMATKRAHISATLNSTAASDIFTQDLEDIPGTDDDLPDDDKTGGKDKPAEKAEARPENSQPSQPESSEHEMLTAGQEIPKWFWNITKDERAKYVPEGCHVKKIDGVFRCVR